MSSIYNYKPNPPYKGLMPYTETDSLIFFGREIERETILKNLITWRLTVLYGPSGVGKSSILGAGVAHYLHQAAQDNVEMGGKPGWAVIVFPPPPAKDESSKKCSWQNPLTGIKKQLQAEMKSLGVEELSLENLSLLEMLKKCIKAIETEEQGGRLFIILDQFEEYFVSLSQRDNQETLNRFVEEFSEAVNNVDLNVSFLISIREESLSKIDYFQRKIDSDLFKKRLELKPLNPDSARKAIEKPVAEYNRQAIVLESLQNTRLTILYGDSDAHKSTLLRDGIVHSLRQPIEQDSEKKERPKLAVVLFNDWDNNNEVQDTSPLIKIKQKIQAEKEEKTKLFIILDQFEEYFLNQPDKTKQQKFMEELVGVIDDYPNINILICIHQDWISELSFFFKEIIHCPCYLHFFKDEEEIDRIGEVKSENINQNTSEQSFREKLGIDKELADEVFKGIIKPKKESEVETFLLQLVMDYLWEEEARKWKEEEEVGEFFSYTLRKKTFLHLGKADKDQSESTKKLSDAEKSVNKIVKDYLSKKLGSPLENRQQSVPVSEEDKKDETLSYEKQDIAASIFHSLVTFGGYKLSQRFSDLFESANEYRKLRDVPVLEESEIPRLRELLEKLDKLRILRPLEDDCYEIFHDVLCQPILKWARKFTDKQDETRKQEKEAERLAEQKAWEKQILHDKMGLIVEKLVGQSLSKKDEKSALLARQAYRFNNKYDLDKLNEVDKALRQAVNTPYFSPILHGHKKQISSVAFSSDSKTFASSSFDGTIQLWDLEKEIKPTPLDLKTRENPGDGGRILSIAFSPNPNEDKLAVGYADGRVRVRDLNSSDTESIPLTGHKNEVWSVAFSPDGNLLASGSWDKKLYLWDLESSKNTPIFGRSHLNRIWSVTFSPDGQTLAAGCQNGTVWLWKVLPSKKLKLLKILVINKEKSVRHKFDKNDENDRNREIFSIAFSPDGKWLVAGSWDGKARFWDLSKQDKTLYPTKEITGQDMQRLMVAFSSDGKWLVLGSSGDPPGKLQLWKLEPNNPTFVEEIPVPGKVSSVAFSKDNQWLVSGSWDGTVRLRDLRPPADIVLQGHQQKVATIAFSPRGKILASGSFDATTRLWEWNNPEKEFIRLKAPNQGNINSVAFSPEGNLLASGNLKGEIWLWNPYDLDKVLQHLEDHGQEISSLAFRPTDGKILAAGSHGNTVLLWDLSNPNQPKRLPSLKGHENKVNSVAFSPDGDILATGDDKHIVRLWWNLELPNPPSNPRSIPLPPFEGRIRSIAFSAKPFKELQMLAVATNQEKIELWDISPLQKSPDDEHEPFFLCKYSSLKELKGTCVAFSPDGLFLASGSDDGKVRLWDLQQPEANPIVLEGHTKPVSTIAFSPDGERLAAGSEDCTIWVWIAKTDKIADMVCQKVRRNLTVQEWKKFVGENIPYERTCPNLPEGEGLSGSGQTDTLTEVIEAKLMPTQKKAFDSVKRKRDLSNLSQEEIVELVIEESKKPSEQFEENQEEIESSPPPCPSIRIDRERGFVSIGGIRLPIRS